MWIFLLQWCIFSELIKSIFNYDKIQLCQSESQDIRAIKDCPKEIDSVASDGDHQIVAFAGANKHGLGERIASSVANTNLLNIPGIFLNFTSKSPIRKQTRSISVTNLNRSYSEVNVAEDFEGIKGISLNETSEDDTDNISYIFWFWSTQMLPIS